MSPALATWHANGSGIGDWTLVEALEAGLVVSVPDSRLGILVTVGRSSSSPAYDPRWEAIAWPWHPEGGRVVGPGLPPAPGATLIESDEPAVVAAMVEDEVKALREPKEPIVYKTRRVGRNEKCRCGSGRKFKQCHLNTVVRL
jgi:hypothetical protein